MFFDGIVAPFDVTRTLKGKKPAFGPLLLGGGGTTVEGFDPLFYLP